MDIFDKAMELGRMIASSDEMTRYKEYEIKIENDEKSKTLLNDYKALQIEMVKATRTDNSNDVIDEIKHRLLAKQDEINNYELTSSFLKSKDDFDDLMKKINDVIIFSISGEETCSQDKCSSCSGGCGK